ncbi:hypothetical protein [Neobacillus mesonae]|uniref:hypothetical protein n=1 Tax=Neobacillus mesonae TaxID=1193713 RepID=UPI002E1B4BE6|nr:hypothetical protein [Neobacillus mesonae]
MKIKSIKGKIAAGAIAVTVIGSSTFAFANTNAGSQFKAWGDAQIAAAKLAISDALAGSLKTAKDRIESKASANKNAAEGRINQAGTDEKAETKSNIEAKLKEHIDSLTSQLATFLATIGGDFNALVTAENNNTTSSLDGQYSALETNITIVLNEAKDTNVRDVTEQSLLVKGEATSKLIQEINRVKQELADEVASQKTAANNKVTTHLNDGVTRINGQLDSLISGLEIAARNSIANAGQDVEDSAAANFDRVINLISDNAPIKVDKQKLQVSNKLVNGNMEWTVTNKNDFDVVFTWRHVKTGAGGVLETEYAKGKGDVGAGKTTFFTTPTDKTGSVIIEWLDEKGTKQSMEVKEANNPK